MDRRTHTQQFHHVEIGAFLGDFSSVKEGALYLARHGIDISIARRVLLTPHLRRKGHL